MCMEFDKSEVLKLIQSDSRYICKPVRYKNIKILNLKKPTVDQLPFTKRIGFKEEKELRILFVGKRKKMNLEQLSIPLGCIKRIILNPWMPKPLSTYVKRTLRGIDGCSNLKITRSTLIENETWKRIAESN